MKSFSVLFAWFSNVLVPIASGKQIEMSTNVISLEEAYGAVKEVSEMERWDDRQQVARVRIASRPESYYAVRTPENCVFPLEVVLVQDTTDSFDDDFKHMKNEQLEAMYDALRKSHPNSTYAVTTFRDIPIWSLGEPRTDYCYNELLSLTDDFKKIRDVYAKLDSTGGGDPNEAQFKALIAAARSSTIGWKDPDATRILVLITDAAPHFEDDGTNAYGLPPYTEVTTDENCDTQFYPSAEAVKQAIFYREAYLVQLVYDGNYFQGGYPADAWGWVNSFLKQTSEFVAPLAQDSSNFWALLSAQIRYIEELECRPYTTAEPSTTTVPHTTETPTTTAAPTTTDTTTGPTSIWETTPTPAPTTTASTTAPTTAGTTTGPTSIWETTPTPAPTTTATTTAIPTTTYISTIVDYTWSPETTATNSIWVDYTWSPETTATTSIWVDDFTTTTVPAPTVTPVGPTEDGCVCPPLDADCECPAVKIVLQDKPVLLKLEVVNNA